MKTLLLLLLLLHPQVFLKLLKGEGHQEESGSSGS